MINNSPEINEAIKLLEEFERTNEIKLNLLEDAFDILDYFISENSIPEFVSKSKNLKATYTKVLIKKLKNIFDFITWASTLIVIFSKFDKEINEAIKDDPELKKNYNDFFERQPWKAELVQLITTKRNW